MLTLWFYGRYTERPASWGRYLAVVASFAMGLAAKPMLVTLPFVLLLLDYWPLGRVGSLEQGAGSREKGAGSREKGAGSREQGAGSREQGGWTGSPEHGLQAESSHLLLRSLLPDPSAACLRLLVEKIPLFLLAAASCSVTLVAQHANMRSLEQVDFALARRQRRGGLCRLPREDDLPGAIWRSSILFPRSAAGLGTGRGGQPCCWRFPRPSSWQGGSVPYLLFGWLWYLGTLVPVIGLVQVGEQAMADRYTYLTQIGLYVAIAWGFPAMIMPAWQAAGSRASSRKRLAHHPGMVTPVCMIMSACSTLVLAALMVCAWQQTQYWRDSETLYTHAR